MTRYSLLGCTLCTLPYFGEKAKRHVTPSMVYVDNADSWNPAPPGTYETLQIVGEATCQLVSRISSINSMLVLKPKDPPDSPWDMLSIGAILTQRPL